MRGEPITKISQLRHYADNGKHVIFYRPESDVERRLFAADVLEKLGAKVVGWMRLGYLFEEKNLKKRNPQVSTMQPLASCVCKR